MSALFTAAPLTRQGVSVEVEKTSWNSRKLFATVEVQAPVELVWERLTDYEHLHTFIPSLVQNKCLSRRPDGAVIYQVGAQEVALGVKFSAACTLDCHEYIGGVPLSMFTTESNVGNGYFPQPKSTMRGKPSRDITFALIEGDFKVFKGVWRMQPGRAGDGTTTLGYSLYVKPQEWLPVGLIQSRIENEVANNLDAVRKHAEIVSKRSGRK